MHDTWNSSSRSQTDGRPTFVRYLVIFFLATAAGSAYLTRHCIAVANTTIQVELELSDEQMGWVLAAFAAGYFACQIPGGWLGDKIGTRAALSLLSTLWSLLTVWSAAVASYLPLLASRVTFGMAQAGLVPNSANVVNNWFPVRRRGLASAVIAASMSVGGVIAMGLTARLMKSVDWRDIFRLYSLVGIAWAIAFYACFRSRPQEHPWVNDAELDRIFADRHDLAGGRHTEIASDTAPADVENGDSARPDVLSTVELFTSMVTNRTIWGINVQSFFRAAGYGLFVTWFPAYLEYRFHATPAEAGNMATYPLAALVLGTMIGGTVVDALLKETGSKWISRSVVAVTALTVCAILVLGSCLATSPALYVTWMSLAAFCSGFAGPCAWAATMDAGGPFTSIVFGVMNMAGTFGGFCMPVVLGYLIGDIKEAGGDWNLVMFFVAGIYAAGAISWLAVDPERGPVAQTVAAAR